MIFTFLCVFDLIRKFELVAINRKVFVNGDAVRMNLIETTHRNTHRFSVLEFVLLGTHSQFE